jgi:hypothetical protein
MELYIGDLHPTESVKNNYAVIHALHNWYPFLQQKVAKTLRQTRIPPTKIAKMAPKPTTKSREPVVVAQNKVGSSQVKITTSRGRTTMRTVQTTK